MMFEIAIWSFEMLMSLEMTSLSSGGNAYLSEALAVYFDSMRLFNVI